MKLHAGGKSNFIKALKEKYQILKEEVNKNMEMTSSEKKVELKRLSESFKSEKRKSNRSLF